MAGEVQIVWETAGFKVGTKALTERMRAAAGVATEMTAQAVIRQAKINATGPPRLAKTGTQGSRPGEGPGVVTGRLRNSIKVTRRVVTPEGVAIDVGATVVYARRLELGFVGTDSLGRRYNQPPYPFLGPAMTFAATYAAPKFFKDAWAAAAR